MITPSPQTSLTNARRYFREHLRVGDYYTEGESIEGVWFGEGAERLGLEGAVRENEFLALCDGNDPLTGETLTLRRNHTRTTNGVEKANRRVFYDFVYRPPKSVSIMAFLEDDRIVDLHRKAVHASLAALERYAETRVRKDGACTDRRTSNVVAALFEHDTSREQDPLLHTHAVVFNATWDAEENHWKALQTREMFKALAYADAVYNTELTRELVRLGYDVHQVGKAWEITGVPRGLIQRFSKRRNHIEQRLAEERAKPSNSGVDVHTLRERIAREERKRKIRGADKKALVNKWRAEAGGDGVKILARLRPAPERTRPTLAKPDYSAALAWGKAFVFERKSVVRLHELLAAAARRLLGTDASMVRLATAVRDAGIVTANDGERITSVDGLRREWSMVERARQERGRHRPFAANVDLSPTPLDAEQQRAVTQLLRSRDGVTLFRGAAGTGKSFALRELTARLESAGHAVRITAPQAQQARGLSDDGMPAVTLAKLLQENELPVGGVVILDEAGQVGGRQMEALFDLARRHAARLILSGDTRQHSAVEASDAMRSLEAFAHVTIAEIKRVRRQDPQLAQSAEERAQIFAYRSAVEAASEGQAETALARLATAGFVHDTRGGDVVEPTADEFDRLDSAGFRVLAVSQTRDTVRELNDAITARLLARGAIREPQMIEAFVPRDTLAAEKSVPDVYEAGTVLRVVRNYGALERGELVTVAAVDGNALTVTAASGVKRRPSLKHSDRWEILERHQLSVGIGSALQLRANGTSLDGRKLVNGEIVTVKAIDPNGTIRVTGRDGADKDIGPDQRVFQLGYAVTSFGSQGKTIDAVLLADAGVAAASHKKEWYVSISRARRKIAVFTPDIRGLASRIAASGDRMLGLELLPEVREFMSVGMRSLIHHSVSRAQSAVNAAKTKIHL